MKADDIIQTFSTMTPEELKEVFGRLTRAFAQKAENLYDENPEGNGKLAQPYSDISYMMTGASEAFDEGEDADAPVDEAPVTANTTRTPTLTEVTSRRNPWGGR